MLRERQVVNMSKLPISVCIIAKNEEKYIEECLKKIKPYGFEIVVTDTGSTDRTKEIALKYADKVLDFEWINDFSAARNYCAANASNNWILALDCDEYMESLDVRILRILMQKNPKHVGVIRLKNIQLRENDELGYSVDDLPRMYNRNYYAFDRPIHEQIVHTKVDSDVLDGFLIPAEVIHHGYAITGEDMIKKQERNLEILYKAIEDEPENPYFYFQTGCSLQVLQKLEEAAAMYEKCLSFDPSLDRVYVIEAITSLAFVYSDLGKVDDAIALMENYTSKSNKANIFFSYANVLFKNDQPLKAVVNYLKATMMPDAHLLGEKLLTCYERIIYIYQKTGNEDLAKPFEQKYLECRAERERIVNS